MRASGVARAGDKVRRLGRDLEKLGELPELVEERRLHPAEALVSDDEGAEMPHLAGVAFANAVEKAQDEGCSGSLARAHLSICAEPRNRGSMTIAQQDSTQARWARHFSEVSTTATAGSWRRQLAM